MRIEIDVDGKTVQTEAQWVAGQLWIHLDGRTFAYQDPNASKRQKNKTHGAHSGELLAPMPGKVTKILRTQGEELQKGDAVLVMEAMKMEYTLKAESPGTLETLNCKVGDQVTLGKILAKIKSGS